MQNAGAPEQLIKLVGLQRIYRKIIKCNKTR